MKYLEKRKDSTKDTITGGGGAVCIMHLHYKSTQKNGLPYKKDD